MQVKFALHRQTSMRYLQSNDVDILLEDGTLGPRVVPASCCNPDVNQPCFHDTLQQNTSAGATLYPKTLFTRGCGELVVNPAVSTVGPFKVLAIAVLLLQVGQLAIALYLHTQAHSSSDEILGKKDLKMRRRRKRICIETEGTSCGSNDSGIEPIRCKNCTEKYESPKKSLRRGASYVKSRTSKIGEAIKNFALPFGPPKSPQKYNVFCTSVDEGSASPFLHSEDDLISTRKSIKWHEEEFAKDLGPSGDRFVPLPKIETAPYNFSDAEASIATPRLLEAPNTKTKWWEPELDLLKLDL